MAGGGGRGDLLHRAPAAAGVELGDRDEQERDRQPDEGRAVQLPEREPAVVERLRDRDEPDRREQRCHDDAHVERVDDRVRAFADTREEGADHRREDRDATESQRVQPQVAGRVRSAKQHHSDRRHRVRLEQVGRHARAVTDVVTDVVGDHGRVARVVLRDTGLDLADQISADVGGLREDAAAEPGEHRDQRAAEREPDEVVDSRLGTVPERAGEEPVVPGDTEQTEADDEQARDRAGAERDLERRCDAFASGLGRTQIRPHGHVHADEAGGRREDGADHEAEGGSPPERVVEPDQQDRSDRDVRDRRVLLAQVGGGALLHGARDLTHALIACRLLEEPVGQVEPEQHRDTGADKRERHSMVIEEVHQPSGEMSQRKRRNRIGAPDYAAQTPALLAEPVRNPGVSPTAPNSNHSDSSPQRTREGRTVRSP